MLRLVALLTVLGSVAADSENCQQPQLGARIGPKRREARGLAFSQIADGVDVKVTYDGSDRSAKYLSSDACNGITHGLEDDGCYALEKDGDGFKLAGLRRPRSGESRVHARRHDAWHARTLTSRRR